MKNIEIEYRAIFTEEKYISLRAFLLEKGEYLGEDNKNVFFFLIPNKLLKVTNNISQNKAKITLKLNEIGNGASFEENEFNILPKDVNSAVKMFIDLGYDQMQESFQKRDNFKYKKVEIALKHSQDWGFHAEFEILIDNPNKETEAELKIRQIAKELDVVLLSDLELIEYTSKLNEKHRLK